MFGLSTHILRLGLVQQVSFLPVSSLIGLAKIEVHLSSLFVLLGFPFIQGHLFRPFLFHLLRLVLPETRLQCPFGYFIIKMKTDHDPEPWAACIIMRGTGMSSQTTHGHPNKGFICNLHLQTDFRCYDKCYPSRSQTHLNPRHLTSLTFSLGSQIHT